MVVTAGLTPTRLVCVNAKHSQVVSFQTLTKQRIMKKNTVQVIYEVEKKKDIYRKIQKISPSKYKPRIPVTQKALR